MTLPVALVTLQTGIESVPLDLLVSVLRRVLYILVFIGFGLTLANLAVEFGLVEYVAIFSRPLTAPANLPDEVGTAILSTAASPTAGYGMLAEFREEGILGDRATLVAVTINTFFGFVQHIFTFYVPVLIPILGLRVGLLYVGSRAAISLAITLTGIVAGAVLLSPPDDEPDELPDGVASDGGPAVGDDDDEEPRTRRETVLDALLSTRDKLRDIAPRLVLVYTIVAMLTASVDISAFTVVAEPVTGLLGLPGEAAAVVGVFAIDTTSGAAFVAPMLGDPFTPEAAVATMLVGGIVSFAFSTFKRSIPFQFGIWGAEFGTKVVVVNTVLKVVFIAATLAVLLVP
ncbi:nucleoside recognition protein [Haloarchaeobius sp. FL176]|uniref:nucleoside recognition protein n=1 Tax=Haloarchaeobius sp. FL176 TaxID=2967129 RepID=UPI0034E9395B